MRVGWLTDLHLDHVEPAKRQRFYAELRKSGADALLIGGDIGEAPSVAALLEELLASLSRPLFFVLGNHDYYHASIKATRRRVAALCREHGELHYLSQGGVVELTSKVGLLGHDGWSDARAGDFAKSTVFLNDYLLIDELAYVPPAELRRRLNALGDEAADHIARLLPTALARYEHVVLLTHPPPMQAACWHQGRISDDNWAPHFTCQAVGDVLLEIMPAWPERQLLVLCGHTHGEGEHRPLENVRILTGGAAYGAPQLQQVFEFAG